jgi:glycosyltransferase involved in cell wall biosynthesis
MSLRVLHIIGSLGLGGAQVSLRTIVENMQDETEHVVYPLRPHASDIHIDTETVRPPYPNYDPRKFFTIISLCKSRRIDIIHAHLSKPIIGALLAAPHIPSKVIIHEHSSVFDRRTSFPGYAMLLRLLRKRASAVIAVSHCVADALNAKMGIPIEQISIIPNAVEFKTFDPTRISRMQARRKYGFTDDDIVLGFVGRLDAIKGPDLAVEALARLSAGWAGYRLILAGTGSMEHKLRKTARELGIAEKVRFMGIVDDVPQVMAACDIGLLPSRDEALGISGLEFMRMKVPLVCSGAGGMAEYAVDRSTAMVTSENTPEDIAVAIAETVHDAALRAHLVEAAYKACDRFSVEAQIQSLSDLYRKVAADKP